MVVGITRIDFRLKTDFCRELARRKSANDSSDFRKNGAGNHFNPAGIVRGCGIVHHSRTSIIHHQVPFVFSYNPRCRKAQGSDRASQN